MKIIKQGNKALGEYNKNPAYFFTCELCKCEFVEKDEIKLCEFGNKNEGTGCAIPTATCPTCGHSTGSLRKIEYKEWMRTNR